ncbi:hypothetical protein Q6A51_25820 [Pseudomonas sp. KFB-139]|uniref:Uncharacterized protein n=1 Tax=Pseudomonas serbiensis TaxID=3064350 RepID=A0ABT9CY89_9PSED|nr:hypothetical protein [Pseudomonas sp. KFB-138]MDO7930199.1 hypothetical protein [Pseudomonas sp. KFB-138]
MFGKVGHESVFSSVVFQAYRNSVKPVSIRLKTIAFSLCFGLFGWFEPAMLLSLLQFDQAPVEPGETALVPVDLGRGSLEFHASSSPRKGLQIEPCFKKLLQDTTLKMTNRIFFQSVGPFVKQKTIFSVLRKALQCQ